MRSRNIVFSSLLLAVAAAGNVQAVMVATELHLLADVSGSVSGAEFALQRDGYVAAFDNPLIHAAIASQPNGIAVQYTYWSGPGQQSAVVLWTHLQNAADSMAFADAILAAGRPFSGATALGDALEFGADAFLNNGFEGDRLVIDVSGDGATNSGQSSSAGRDHALNTVGVDTINGLVIGGSASVLTHYQNEVIGGANSFVETAANFNEFEAAILTKLESEIVQPPSGNVPEPSALLVWPLLGLCAFGSARWVKKRSGK